MRWRLPLVATVAISLWSVPAVGATPPRLTNAAARTAFARALKAEIGPPFSFTSTICRRSARNRVRCTALYFRRGTGLICGSVSATIVRRTRVGPPDVSIDRLAGPYGCRPGENPS